MTDAERLLDEKYAGVRSAEYENDVERLACGEPLAYVIGWQPFLGLNIYLDSKPLIPRPETEWWTEELIAAVRKVWPARQSSDRGSENSSKGGNELRFLDLCAGSGAIGCAALARLPTAQVYFGEIDPAHEPTILKNIRENKLDESRVAIGIGDLFVPFGGMRFDVIAANPPYIPADRELFASVADFEPAKALFAGTDGLDLIRRIAAELLNRLNPGGIAWIEFDSEHAAETQRLFEEQGLHTSILADQYARPRVLVVNQI